MRPDVAGVPIDGKGDVPAEPPGLFALVLSGDRAIAGGADEDGVTVSIVSRRHSTVLIEPRTSLSKK
ncbi:MULTISPECIES: hypothetical protein [unclassified Rhizobium]|uniref:hypothetical protein n=1 Tax=unclassified Rhizobium TaxID=2613769 RepID=UPI0013C496EA|nr:MULTISPECIES: hypothetical protein [unclassified Rhizobium]